MHHMFFVFPVRLGLIPIEAMEKENLALLAMSATSSIPVAASATP
jgi:hypothetical protein